MLVKNVVPSNDFLFSPSNSLRPVAEKLRPHMETKVHNTKWISKFITANPEELPNLVSFFPFRIHNGFAELKDVSEKTLGEFPSLNSTPFNPAYIIGIPFYISPTSGTDALKPLLEKIAKESFGTTTLGSQISVRQRVVVIILANRMYSIDSRKNTLKEWVDSVQKIHNIYVHIIGNYWVPKRSKIGLHTYELSKAWKILNNLCPEAGELVETYFEKSDVVKEQLPMQKIRERIFKSPQVRIAFEAIKNRSQVRPIYFVSLDSDTVALNRVLANYDKHIRKIKSDILSSGYNLPAAAPLLTQFNVMLDRNIRIALSKVGLLPYLPEPNLAIYIKSLFDLNRLSWVTDGGSLESNSFIHNALRQNLIQVQNCTFIDGPCVTTATPDRFVTDYATNTVLTRSNFFAKTTLQGLRGKAQTHALPKNWSHGIYMGLKQTVSNFGEYNGHVATILKWTSYLSFVTLWTEAKNRTYSRTIALQTLLRYPIYSEMLKCIFLGGESEEIIVENFELTLVHTAQTQMLNAKTALQALGLSEKNVNLIIKGAFATGQVEIDLVAKIYGLLPN